MNQHPISPRPLIPEGEQDAVHVRLDQKVKVSAGCSLRDISQLDVANSVILRQCELAVCGNPSTQQKGSVEWARAECNRYHCSFCHNPLIRGTQRCRVCNKDVANELDGSF